MILKCLDVIFILVVVGLDDVDLMFEISSLTLAVRSMGTSHKMMVYNSAIMFEFIV
jgi:hypothetical protein